MLHKNVLNLPTTMRMVLIGLSIVGATIPVYIAGKWKAGDVVFVIKYKLMLGLYFTSHQ